MFSVLELAKGRRGMGLGEQLEPVVKLRKTKRRKKIHLPATLDGVIPEEERCRAAAHLLVDPADIVSLPYTAVSAGVRVPFLSSLVGGDD